MMWIHLDSFNMDLLGKQEAGSEMLSLIQSAASFQVFKEALICFYVLGAFLYKNVQT